jgi:hypothetical protein
MQEEDRKCNKASILVIRLSVFLLYDFFFFVCTFPVISRIDCAGKGGAGIRTRPQGLPVLISSDPSFPGSSLMPGPWPA